jgi:hypothetical protein
MNCMMIIINKDVLKVYFSIQVYIIIKYFKCMLAIEYKKIYTCFIFENYYYY